MFDDDLEPQKRAKPVKNLEPMSFDELAEYIEEMKQEITRAEAEITRKKAHMAAAASIFK